MKYRLIDSPLFTIAILMLSGLSLFVSTSLSAGILIGLISFLLINLFLSILTGSGNIKRGLTVPILNLLKFATIVIILYICIKHLKLNPIMLATGYSLTFTLSIARIVIMRPKEL